MLKFSWARIAGLAVALLGLALPAGAQLDHAQFSDAQVARGKAAYDGNCQACHGANLDDGEFGPPVKGAVFKGQWGSRSATSLFLYISAKMPATAPGSLAPQAYADIEAFLLSANGAKAGSTELSAAALAADAAKNGTPVPEFAMLWGPANRDASYKAVMSARDKKLAALTPVTDVMLRNPPAGDWLNWRRTYDAHGRSPLTQINTSNVAGLNVAWTWTLPTSTNEITPVVHDGVLFVKSANEVHALDAASGDLLWKYVRPMPPGVDAGHTSVKNIAIWQDKLMAPMADGHMVALNIKTGALAWDTAILNAEEMAAHLSLDGGPTVAKGKVIMGASSCNGYKGGCFIAALDAATGKPAWRFYTIARPGQPGGDSWNGAPLDQRYGGAVWTSGSYDPARNLIFFGTGQTYDTSTLLQPRAAKGASNDALYTDLTLALNVDTGKLEWHYQHMNRDVWDLDWVFEQSLINLPVKGKPTDLVVTAGKIAVFDAMNRDTGKYAFSHDLGLQNLVTKIDPVTGAKTINPDLTPQANVTKLLCPHGGGARTWFATSYDAAAKTLFVPLNEHCAHFTWNPRSEAETQGGGNDMHWVIVPRPGSDGNIGRVEAINLQTGKVLWKTRQRSPEAGSLLGTAGGLLFDETRDRYIRALDAATGKVLWRTRLNAVPSSTPVTFMADGRQYVAITTGGGNPQEATYPSLTPEIDEPVNNSTTLWVFALPHAAH